MSSVTPLTFYQESRLELCLFTSYTTECYKFQNPPPHPEPPYHSCQESLRRTFPYKPSARMRRRVTVVVLSVCLSVCLSVKSHLTAGASVRPANTVTYSAGKRGQKICGVFSETALLLRSSTPPLKAIRSVGHFPAESAHANYSN